MRTLFRPAGLSIAILGPDGSGKSTVLAEIERRLAPHFVKVHRFHLRPGLLPDAGVLLRRREAHVGPVADPHGRSPHSAPVAFVRLCWFACDYIVGHLTRIRKALAQSHLVLFDRHAADFACDPRRYRFALPAWLLRAAVALLPKPGLTFVLLADAATISQRKGEIPGDAVSEVLAGYERLAKGRAIGVDATRPVEEVVGEIERHVLAFMKARVRA
jgi:thymidylate kinase